MRPGTLCALSLLALASAAGCGGGGAATGGAGGGRADVLVVPGWPVTPVRRTARMATLARILEEAEALPPALSEGWVGAVYAPWIAERTVRIEQVTRIRDELRAAPAGARAVAVGLYGALLARTADQLARAALPALPEAAQAEVRAPVQALRGRAARAFSACHQLALEGGAAFDGWRRECDRRRDRIRPADRRERGARPVEPALEGEPALEDEPALEGEPALER